PIRTRADSGALLLCVSYLASGLGDFGLLVRGAISERRRHRNCLFQPDCRWCRFLGARRRLYRRTGHDQTAACAAAAIFVRIALAPTSVVRATTFVLARAIYLGNRSAARNRWRFWPESMREILRAFL